MCGDKGENEKKQSGMNGSMNEVFRIRDRFKIAGRGTIYTLEISKGTAIHAGDILFDLAGNRFKVEGVEMFRETGGQLFHRSGGPYAGQLFQL